MALGWLYAKKKLVLTYNRISCVNIGVWKLYLTLFIQGECSSGVSVSDSAMEDDVS
jgi:hypothetical protein